MVNPYRLLAAFLAPGKNGQTLAALRQTARSGAVDWKALLRLANGHLCTPLWYVRLRQDDLLPELPEELQRYLACLHEANLERNLRFRAALVELLKPLRDKEIPALLLKGAAVFCDDLYGDPGARIMADLDVLVPAGREGQAEAVLRELGYEAIPDPGMERDGLPTDARHHQLLAHYRPGEPVVVEIHFKVCYGQASLVLSDTQMWATALEASVDGMPCRIPLPQERLVHNAVHELIQHRGFIDGEISLRQLAEFAALAERYGQHIDWDAWQVRGRSGGFEPAFPVLYELGRRLMGGPWMPVQKISLPVRFHLCRLMPDPSGRNRLARVYYYLALPFWVWNNVGFVGGRGHWGLRLTYLLKKMTGTRSRVKIRRETR